MAGLRTAQVRQLMVTADLAGTTLYTLPHQLTLLTQESSYSSGCNSQPLLCWQLVI